MEQIKADYGTTPVKQPFQTIDRILAAELYQPLSREARRLYSGVWNSSNWARRNPARLRDEDVCRRAKIQLRELRDVQDELEAAGLIKVVIDLDGTTNWAVLDPDAAKL
jgi:replication initiation and membrane attachment protein DnaB